MEMIMKKNQMDVMRKVRDEAIKEQSVKFLTFHIKDPDKWNSALQTPQSRKHKGSITVAFKQIPPEILRSELLRLAEIKKSLPIVIPQTRYFCVQYAFCSPKEKNPSRIFGEGLATLRLSNDKSNIILPVGEGQNFIKELKRCIIFQAFHRSVPWMKNITAGDLV
jgi:hypothetical protein